MTKAHDRQRWLRTSLLGNAAFSTLSGISFTVAAGPVATFIGLEHAWIVRAIGIGLLGFAGYIGFLATRREIDPRAALAIILGDLSWVLATIPIVLLGVLSTNGVWAALAIAEIVLLFAGLQYWGLRRTRNAQAPSPAATA